MAKIVRKKQKLRLDRLAIFSLVVAGVVSLSSSLFLGAYNNELTMKVQHYTNEIKALEKNNEQARISIQGLSSKERVVNVATENGMVLNQENVVTVVDDGE